METLDLKHSDNEIYNEFVQQENLQNPELTGDKEAAEIYLTFDRVPDPSNTYKKALLHFDMSFADTELKVGDRTTITFQF